MLVEENHKSGPLTQQCVTLVDQATNTRLEVFTMNKDGDQESLMANNLHNISDAEICKVDLVNSSINHVWDLQDDQYGVFEELPVDFWQNTCLF